MDYDMETRNARFAAYLSQIAEVLDHDRRTGPLTSYCTGLLSPCERKSVEPMAAMTAPRETAAQHQRMLHFVGQGTWSDAAVLERVRSYALPKITAHGPISAWIFDDTGFPKKGTHSVGVARQYCGQLGKQDNCQVAVSLSIANDHASLPVAYQLYLPKVWADDQARRDKVGVPEDITFKTKPQIALDQLKWACETNLPRGVILADAGYGVDAAFRSGITDLGLTYVAGIKSTTTVWAPGTAALAPPPKKSARGRPAVRPVHDGANKPVSVEQLALSLPERSWQMIGWREGTNARLTGRFARVRVRPAHERDIATEKIAEEWLLIEWPEDERKPTKFWLSTLDATVTFTHLIHMTKMRWRIERDYLDLKQEVGLGHFEGRSWRGFHHHATLCIASYAFLVSERAAFSPSQTHTNWHIEIAAIPEGHRPRGAAHPH